MAGMALPISTTSTERENYEVSAEIGEWKVGYARFIFRRSSSCTSTHPSLVPVAKNRTRGTWISAGAVASVKLVYELSSDEKDDGVLTVYLGSKTLEVHYTSKIQFSWPQVLCVSGFPARGSRVVLLSYTDGGQMQKFALRFASLPETENFMNVVKEIMETGSPKLLQGPEINSGVSSEAEGTLSHVTLSKGNNKGNSTQLSSVLRSSQDSEPHKGQLGDGEAVRAEPSFPPGFTQLMNSCCPEVSRSCSPSSIVPFNASLADYLSAATKLGSGDLKTQFVQYLEGTSFSDLLATVETVIGQLGDDMVL